MRTYLTMILCVLAAPLFAGESDFQALFDGKTLDGWHGDPELWSVQDGVIVGSTKDKKIKRNSFLATEKEYSDFVLNVKFKLENHNSGIQYRSKQHDNFRVTGYQADIAENQFMGILYEEGGRGILANVKKAEVAKHFKPGEWNQYEITVQGNHLVQKLNGFTTVDFTDNSEKGASSGIIAFQLHVGPPMKIYFKEIEIRELTK